jgi:hypothetical protein
VRRGSPPKKILTESNLRKYALPALLRDFHSRCAYSMQHRRRAGGSEMLMEIDHFDPTIHGRKRNRYDNLFLSSRHCNNKKQGNWPTKSQQLQGIRFLNCCKELDYGRCIFEDAATHRVFGTTPAARYHVRILDLNAPHFVEERAERAHYRTLLYKARKRVRDAMAAIEVFQILRHQVEFLIPPIPYRTVP